MSAIGKERSQIYIGQNALIALLCLLGTRAPLHGHPQLPRLSLLELR